MASRFPGSFLSTIALLLLVPEVAGAYDFEVTARTEGYGYQLRRLGPDGVTLLNRRRVTQYLGLRVFNMLDPGQRAFRPRGGGPPALLTGHALMRFHTDFGAYGSPGPSIPELQNNQLELVLGAVEGRNLWGLVDFTLGRQLDAELMDFFVFDGLRLRINTPWRLYVESHIGLQTRRGNPLSSTITVEGDGRVEDEAEDGLAPTFGVAIGAEDLVGIDLRVAYRGTASRAAPPEEEAVGELWGIDQEILFFSAAYTVPLLGTRPMFGLRYSLLTGQLDEVQATLSQRLGAGRHQAQVEYTHSRPHFDGDSIFNVFAAEPYDEIAGRYTLAILRPLQLDARLGYRRFWDADGADPDAAPEAISAGMGGQWRSAGLNTSLDLFYLGGLGDTTVGGDLAGRWRITRRIAIEGRLSLIWYQQATHRAAEDVLNLGLQLGGTLRLVHGAKLHLLIEDNISRLYDSALRLLGVLDLEFAP